MQAVRQIVTVAGVEAAGCRALFPEAPGTVSELVVGFALDMRCG